MGSPIKRPLSRGKTYPGRENLFSRLTPMSSYRHLHLCRDFFQISVTAFAAPVTHQDQGQSK
jgi:hypothetical protein